MPKNVRRFCDQCRRRRSKESTARSNAKRREFNGAPSTRATGTSRNQHQCRIWVCEYLTQNPCVDCGEPDIVTLHFDHRDPRTKRYNISEILTRGLPVQTLIDEAKKCDVRCANCHAVKTARESKAYRIRYLLDLRAGRPPLLRNDPEESREKARRRARIAGMGRHDGPAITNQRQVLRAEWRANDVVDRENKREQMRQATLAYRRQGPRRKPPSALDDLDDSVVGSHVDTITPSLKTPRAATPLFDEVAWRTERDRRLAARQANTRASARGEPPRSPIPAAVPQPNEFGRSPIIEGQIPGPSPADLPTGQIGAEAAPEQPTHRGPEVHVGDVPAAVATSEPVGEATGGCGPDDAIGAWGEASFEAGGVDGGVVRSGRFVRRARKR